jgi:hypothetical protein
VASARQPVEQVNRALLRISGTPLPDAVHKSSPTNTSWSLRIGPVKLHRNTAGRKGGAGAGVDDLDADQRLGQPAYSPAQTMQVITRIAAASPAGGTPQAQERS